MKKLDFKNEVETSEKVVELTRRGIKFVTTGRTSLIIL